MLVHAHYFEFLRWSWNLKYNTISLQTDLDISTIMITSSWTIMDFKCVKSPPATLLNMERVYLSALYCGQYLEVVPDSYRGKPPSEWEKLHSQFPAPASVQLLSDEFQFCRKQAAVQTTRPFVCGCSYCQDVLEKVIAFFHSIMDAMLLETLNQARATIRNVIQ